MTHDSLNPPGSTIRLTRERLEHLRDQLRTRGQRPSVATGPKTSADVLEAMQIVEEYGPICEAMYLMMSADHRVVNAEREVLKGALDVLSGGRVRSMHMEAMLDSAARRCAKDGRDVRLKKVIEQLRDDAARADVTVVLAAAVAAADARIVPEESAVLDAMFKGLGITTERANELLNEVDGKVSD
jgi:tellurite resistance protein